MFATDPLVFPPGSDYGYSSYGFNLLGAALERAGRASYAQLLRREVLSPLALPHTRLDAPAGRAALYEVGADRRPRAAPRVDLSDRYPSGGLLSTAEELARLGSRLGDPDFLIAGDAGRLLQGEEADHRAPDGLRARVRDG